MQIKLRPVTKLGKYSFFSVVVFVISFVLSIIIVRYSTRTFGDEVYLNPSSQRYLTITGISSMVSGFIAFIMGLVSIVKFQERSIIVIIATILGSLTVLLLVGELFVPHE